MNSLIKHTLLVGLLFLFISALAGCSKDKAEKPAPAASGEAAPVDATPSDEGKTNEEQQPDDMESYNKAQSENMYIERARKSIKPENLEVGG